MHVQHLRVDGDRFILSDGVKHQICPGGLSPYIDILRVADKVDVRSVTLYID
jgi:hypothetical protein